MAVDNEKVLKRLKNVGNPIFLLKLINNTTKFINTHQMMNKAKNVSEIYLNISLEYYIYMNGVWKKTDILNDESGVIQVSKEAVDELAELLESDSSDINKMFKEMRRIKNIQRYQEIFEIFDNSFKINLSISQLIRFAV